MESIQDVRFMATPHEAPLPTALNTVVVATSPLYKNTYSAISSRQGFNFATQTTADDQWKFYFAVNWSSAVTIGANAGTVTGSAVYTGTYSNLGAVTTQSETGNSSCWALDQYATGTVANYTTFSGAFGSDDANFTSASYTDTNLSWFAVGATGTATCTLSNLQDFNTQLIAPLFATPTNHYPPIWPGNVTDSWTYTWFTNSDGNNDAQGLYNGFMDPAHAYASMGIGSNAIIDWNTGFVASGASGKPDNNFYPLVGQPNNNGYVTITDPHIMLSSFCECSGAPSNFPSYQSGHPMGQWFGELYMERFIWNSTTPTGYIIAEVVTGQFNDLTPGSPQTIHNAASGTLGFGTDIDTGSWTTAMALPFHFTDPATSKDSVAQTVQRILFIGQSFAAFAAANFPSASII